MGKSMVSGSDFTNWYLDLAHRSGISTKHLELTNQKAPKTFWLHRQQSWLNQQAWVISVCSRMSHFIYPQSMAIEKMTC
jgi:hypothetical protein